MIGLKEYRTYGFVAEEPCCTDWKKGCRVEKGNAVFAVSWEFEGKEAGPRGSSSVEVVAPSYCSSSPGSSIAPPLWMTAEGLVP